MKKNFIINYLITCFTIFSLVMVCQAAVHGEISLKGKVEKITKTSIYLKSNDNLYRFPKNKYPKLKKARLKEQIELRLKPYSLKDISFKKVKYKRVMSTQFKKHLKKKMDRTQKYRKKFK